MSAPPAKQGRSYIAIPTLGRRTKKAAIADVGRQSRPTFGPEPPPMPQSLHQQQKFATVIPKA
jgi:hypothetical protein